MLNLPFCIKSECHLSNKNAQLQNFCPYATIQLYQIAKSCNTFPLIFLHETQVWKCVVMIKGREIIFVKWA